MRRVVGVDPGVSGAVAMIDGETGALLGVSDFVSAEGVLGAGLLVDTLTDWRPALAVIERVHSMPGQGVASMFKFGRALGTVEGIVAALDIPSDYIAPHVWKARMGVTRDKRSSLAAASRLWPQHRELFARQRDDGRAEAALLAVAYCRRLMLQRQAAVCHHAPHDSNDDEA